jgi:leukotriene-A4 hydrolase
MKFKRLILLVAVACWTVGCSQQDPASAEDLLAKDNYSFANTAQFVTQHLHLDLAVDFASEVLHGTATLTMRREDSAAHEIILDTRDLAIEDVAFIAASGVLVGAEYSLGETDDFLGTPLVIAVPDELQDQPTLDVHVAYRTSPESTALGWLPPELTAGGEHPFLFSQSQSIHARSWVPLQDTPAIRITYSARIQTPPNLLAVMSANNDPEVDRTGIYEFDMPQPIPAYLLAIAVGNLYFAEIGNDTGVYAEPELLDAAAFEFADTQAMFETAEAMFGPYRWGRYDLLILPPSFPYGGMENPRLSFLTPSLLAGDRSLVAVVAHELAHSWSGNLVTNQTWRDGWLNEGWTSYLEYRLMQVIYDEDRANEENLISYEELLLNFETIDPRYQALAPRDEDLDPEEGQGTIAYHKGNLFLQYLENRFGRETFDRFITDYFDEFAFQVITTEDFVDFLDERLLSAHDGIVTRAQVEKWMYEPGLPDDALLPSSANLERAAELAALWSRGEIETSDLPVSDWSPQATIHFINSLDADLPTEKLVEIDAALDLSQTKNAEIGRTWFIQVAKRQHRPAYEHLAVHLQRFGRTRLVRPVYIALAENGADLDLANELFSNARGDYHPLTNTSIERALNKVQPQED